MSDRSIKILQGDVFECLSRIPDDSVDCVVTSPPYWGLRDYGVDGQIGLERNLGEHLDVMVRVFREVRRVLNPSGTLWLNYGDCYATSPNGRCAADTKATGNDDRTFRDKPFSTVGPIYHANHESGDRRGKSGNKGSAGQEMHTGRIVSGGNLKPKDLCMIPNRLAIALQEDGWWVRSECIWGKRNPMPDSSGKYRPSTAPPELVERCLKAGCPKGGTVLDPFGGSGTTALVADGLGMDSVLIELNPAYVEIAKKRLGDMFRQVAVEVAA